MLYVAFTYCRERFMWFNVQLSPTIVITVTTVLHSKLLMHPLLEAKSQNHIDCEHSSTAQTVLQEKYSISQQLLYVTAQASFVMIGSFLDLGMRVKHEAETLVVGAQLFET